MFDLAVMYHFHAILQIPANFFIFFKFFTFFITIQKSIANSIRNA